YVPWLCGGAGDQHAYLRSCANTLRGRCRETRRINVTLNVLAVSSEAFPLAKSGGLGDAVSGMVQTLAGEGVAVTLLLPAYPGAREQLQAPRELAVLPGLPGGAATLLAGYCRPLGIRVLLLDNDALYGRDSLYVTAEGEGYADNHLRFAALCHAAAAIGRGLPGVQRP